jgi:2-polyprenyl-6-methoxyphenol hydroxylase-like FAD-dependent oxidoreductase
MNMATTASYKILICGAGVAGPALAYWLTRIPHAANWSITVLERSPSPRTTGQAIDIRGPAVKVLQQMGVEAEVRQRHTNEKGARYHRPLRLPC